ncbi:MAG: hypothetical protein ACFFDP_07630 [Promethearchaeota archaeon]
MADKFLLLLDFSGGIIEPLPLSPDVLTDDRIVIIIDELKECIWLWLGANTTLIERRASQRKARSIRSAGYQFGPLKIGRDISSVEIIDGQILDDKETKEYYETLLHSLSQKFTITDKVLGRLGGTPTKVKAPSPMTPSTAPSSVSPPTPVSTPAPSPTPSPQPKPATSKPATSQIEDVAPAPSRSFEDLGVIRAGILISSILDYFPLCYVSVTKTGESKRYTIEDAEGVICELEVADGSVHFLSRYDFRGKRDEILRLLRDRLASADL